MAHSAHVLRSIGRRVALATAVGLAGASGHLARAGTVRLVTVGSDSADAPAPGSLRYVLRNDAQPGDTIRFAQNFSISLDAEDPFVRIGDALTGLTIEGPAEIRNGWFLTEGDATTITGLRFTNVSVGAGNVLNLGTVSELRTDDFVFRGNTLVGSSSLELDVARNALVEDNTFDVRLPHDDIAIGDFGSEGSRWVHNTWTGTSLGGFAESECTDIVFEGGNSVVGNAFFQPRSGRISGNAFTGEVRVSDCSLVQKGPFTIEGNTCAALYAHRPDLTISDNTITGVVSDLGKSRPYPVTVTRVKGGKVKVKQSVVRERLITAFSAGMGYQKGDGGFLRVIHNDVTATQGWIGGMQVLATDFATECLVERNTVRGATGASLRVVARKSATLRGNTVGSAGEFGGILLGGPASDGWTLEDNTVDGGAGPGIVISKGRGAATLRRNTVRGCKTGALVVAGRPFSTEDGTYENCATGVVVGQATAAAIRGGAIRGNAGAGVFAGVGSTVEVARTSFSGNGGAGIDLAPLGVTPNTKAKKANGNVPYPTDLVFEEATGRVTGRAEPLARIDGYGVEEGARAGNPSNGEGVTWLDEVFADANGDFTFPGGGRVPCPPSKKLTFTATRGPKGPVVLNPRYATSEFSEDVECTEGPAVELVSKSGAGEVANQRSDTSTQAALQLTTAGRLVAGGGRHVVFVSQATNLDAGPHTVRNQYVFLRDTALGTTTRISRTSHRGAFRQPPGLTVEYAGDAPTISEDGRWIAFVTTSDEVVAGDEDNYPTVVLFDAQTSQTVAVTDPALYSLPLPDGRFTHLGGRYPGISGDGSAVVFTSIDRNWAGDTDLDYDEDVFVWTRTSGAMERVSVPSGGGDVDGSASAPRISHDGRFVTFTSSQVLVQGAAAGSVYLRDRQTGTTTLVSADSNGVPRAAGSSSVSDDGRYVSFESSVAMLPGDTNGKTDVYVLDRQSGALRRVSLHADGSPFAADCYGSTMSGDGRRIAFVTTGEFVPPEGITVLNLREVWLADLDANTVVEASGGAQGDANASAQYASLARDGRAVVFSTPATNLVPEVTTFDNQIYLRRLPAGN